MKIETTENEAIVATDLTKSFGEGEAKVTAVNIRPVGSNFDPIRSVETVDYDGVIMAGYFLAVLLPLFGFFVGVYLLIKSQHGHGVSAMALGIAK